jgi:hypothetical protein
MSQVVSGTGHHIFTFLGSFLAVTGVGIVVRSALRAAVAGSTIYSIGLLRSSGVW